MRSLFLTTSLLLFGPIFGTIFHVANNGNDTSSGLSIGIAFATIQRGSDVAQAGDTVMVHPGSYAGFHAMSQSGTANDPIIFLANGTVQIISPNSFTNQDGINVENVSWVVIDGFTVNDMPRAGIRSALSDHITIRNNVCANNGKWGIFTGFAEHILIEHNQCSGSIDEHGIYFSNSADDPVIRYNECFDNNANGIHMNGDVSLGGDGVISNAQVYGNMIHGNGSAGGSGINCDGVVNSVIFNNLLYDNHASGISLYQIDGGAPSTNNKVFNNTIVNASDARWCVNITDDCTGNMVLNNILINQHAFRGSIVIEESALTGFQSDHNLVVGRLSPDGDATILDLGAWQALGYDANSQIAGAQGSLFVSPGSDLHALNSVSQQVDAGTNTVDNVVLEDLDGTPRPLGNGFDIGCYEYVGNTGITEEQTGLPVMRIVGEYLWIDKLANGSTLSWYGVNGSLLDTPRTVTGQQQVIPVAGSCIAVLRTTDGHVRSLPVVH